MTEQDRQLGRDQGHDHGDDQGDSRPTRSQTQDDQQATYGFDHADERTEKLRPGNANAGETTGTEDRREQQILQTFGKEHRQTDCEADQDDGRAVAC